MLPVLRLEARANQTSAIRKAESQKNRDANPVSALEAELPQGADCQFFLKGLE
jgi:hypothetical protein